MSLLRVESYTISLDGYGAGPEQSREAPLGIGGETLHRWMIRTRTFHAMTGQEGGSTGPDDAVVARGFENIGAWIMGRNMFTHERGDWFDPDWRGWWGEEPPYHCDVFVLTHHPRAPMQVGETTFHFTDETPEAVLARAKEVAAGKDVRLGGGAETLRQFFAAGLIDRAHIAVSHVLLGSGEPLWHGLDLPALGYRLASTETIGTATHLMLEKG